MNITRTLIALAALGLAGGSAVLAQSNGVPGATDYGSFSRFITDRNIFDPNRQPHYSGAERPRITHHHTHISVSAPAFSYVGAMTYSKGLFAFFNGNSPELKQILVVGQAIAGYTVTEITLDRVKLVSADKKESLELKVGEVMRQDSGKWVATGAGEIAGQAAAASPGGASGTTPAGGDAAAPTGTAPSATAPNDILKRLMQLREKENQ